MQQDSRKILIQDIVRYYINKYTQYSMEERLSVVEAGIKEAKEYLRSQTAEHNISKEELQSALQSVTNEFDEIERVYDYDKRDFD